MGQADFLRLGDWNAICYECGKKFKASTMKRQWQGYYVCTEHWTPRQPQDFVRGTKDVQTPPWTQAVPEPIWVAGSPTSPPAPNPDEYPQNGED